MKITAMVLVKGDSDALIRNARRHGMSVRGIQTVRDNGGETRATAIGDENDLVRWFCRDANAKPPFDAGSLLWYWIERPEDNEGWRADETTEFATVARLEGR